MAKTKTSVLCIMEDGKLQPISGKWGNAGMGPPDAFQTFNTTTGPSDPQLRLLSTILDDNPPDARPLTEYNVRKMISKLEKYKQFNSPLLAALKRHLATMNA